MNLIKHAERELKLAGMDSKESIYDGMLYNCIMELVKCFSKQGHSGYSARITLDLFSKLSNFENLSNLTYEDDEFGDNNQNIRYSSVFREPDTNKYTYINAIKFIDETGSVFTGGIRLEDGSYLSSNQYIKHKTLPLKTFMVEIESIDSTDTYKLIDNDILTEIFEYYDRKDV